MKVYSNPKCYAAGLRDCSQELSDEHYISHSVLREIEKTYREGETLSVGGFPWQEESLSQIPPRRLVSKILCKHHNNALSELDAAGVAFFRAFHSIHNENKIDGRAPTYIFQGHDVERWMLKTLCGIVASGGTNNVPKGTKPPIPYLKCLFNNEKLPQTFGLYLLSSKGPQEAIGGINFAILSDGRKVKGLQMQILAFKFILMVQAVPMKTDLLEGATNRPDQLHFFNRKTKNETIMQLQWDIKGDGGSISIEKD